MTCKKTWWFAVALACAGCSDDGDEDTGAGPTDGGPTSADDGSTSADDEGTTSGGSTSGGSTSGGTESETGHHDGSTGHQDGSTGHHETEGHETAGSETGQSVCDVLGEGCHDNETPEGIECHLTGHDGDEAACMKVFDMCAEICGL